MRTIGGLTICRELSSHNGNHQMGVLNSAITGNRLVHDGIGSNALARFERDVLTQAGVTHVIVLLGNNDIIVGNFLPGEVVTSAEIVQAHRMLIARARAQGLTVYGGTLPPFMGAVPETVFAALDAKRRAVNEWIRFGGEYDTVIDFDAILRDPSADGRLLPLYDSGDHLHPNDAGYEVMGRAIDLSVFKQGQGGSDPSLIEECQVDIRRVNVNSLGLPSKAHAVLASVSEGWRGPQRTCCVRWGALARVDLL